MLAFDCGANIWPVSSRVQQLMLDSWGAVRRMGFLLRRCLRCCPSLGSRSLWTAHLRIPGAFGFDLIDPHVGGLSLGRCTPVSICAV